MKEKIIPEIRQVSFVNNHIFSVWLKTRIFSKLYQKITLTHAIFSANFREVSYHFSNI
jgi:hypothetical protein